MSETASNPNAIAVIGMAGRFPGAGSIEAYWHAIAAGTECITRFSDEQLLAQGVARELLRKPNYVKSAPIAEGLDLFDAPLFGLTKREAEATDPQHRIFWECAWQALERAGYPPTGLTVPAGVFASCTMNLYLLQAMRQNPEFVDNLGALQMLISCDKDFLATRLSYLLNLQGPAYTVQTACSSSLVAVHQACQSLLNYECDIAIAGGSSVRVPQIAGYLYQEGLILSRDGHCRPFDAAASGTLFGEGVGVVVLKRLADALADKDIIDAVVIGSAINNDGNRKAGYTAPSVEGQSACIGAALSMAEAHAESIGYVECHGTGTLLGDPIEVRALSHAFNRQTGKRNYCALGSAKAAIGHLDAAAGIAGLIKAVLCVKHRTIPPCVNFRRPNPELDLPQSPFYVPESARQWGRDQQVLRAGVSSFGIGGTNAHVVVQSTNAEPRSANSGGRFLIAPLSARSEGALQQSAELLAQHLSQTPTAATLADAAYTLAVGRSAMSWRRAAVGCSQSLVPTLTAATQPVHAFSQAPEVVMLFPGQGSQYPGMFRALYHQEPLYRQEIDECAERLTPQLGLDLRSLLGAEQPTDERTALLTQTRLAQPALFIVEYALYRQLAHWGIRPALLLGHSIGEYVAACIAGVFDRNTGLSIVATRAALMQQQPPGSMLAVEASREQVAQLLGPELQCALVNAPQSCVVAGSRAAVTEAMARCQSLGIKCRMLHTSHAFHSRLMEGAVAPLVAHLQTCALQPPQIPLVSNVTGQLLTAHQATDPQYWGLQLRNTVAFDQCMQSIQGAGRLFIEVGPGAGLRTLAMRNGLPAGECIGVGHPASEASEDLEAFYHCLGAAWCKGVAVDWQAMYAGQSRRRVVLPTYPFERKSYWLDARSTPSKEASGEGPQTAVCNQPRKVDPVAVDETLARLWCELLGVAQAREQDDFFAVGGHSLHAAQLFAAINRTLAINAPLALLFSAPTFGALRDQIRKLAGPEKGWPSLMPIRPDGSRPPLFLIHGAEGNVLLYRDLAEALPVEQPIYGLQSQGLDQVSTPLTTISEMAQCYVKEINGLPYSGPILLCGYCLGGAIALEMARLFRVAGRPVLLTAMIESYNPAFFAARRTPVVESVIRMQNVYYHVRNLVRGGSATFLLRKSAVEMRRMRLRALELLAQLGLANAQAANCLPHRRIARLNDAAFFAYQPQPFDGELVVFRPFRSFYAYADPACGWGTLGARIRLEVPKVYPRGMLVAPFVRRLGDRIDSIIVEALEKQSLS
jgi:acyl transferase domain-containing protein/thioesterase domain-containing protein